MFAIARIALILALLASRLAAQEQPDMASLPGLTRPGSLTAQQMQHQAAWLEVAEAGLYRLTMDGPGLLGLTGFRTPDGRSDGSDPQERLVQDGDAYRPGTLDDLLLEPGRAYFLQTGATAPRAVTLTLVQPLDAAAALSGDAMPGQKDQIWPVAPGTQALLRPSEYRTLTLSSTGSAPLRIEAIVPPGADASAHYRGHQVGAGGILPVTPEANADLRVDGRKGADGKLPLMLIRVTAAPDPTLEEREPKETPWGTVPPGGRKFRGILLAPSDRDDVDFTLTEGAEFDLSLTLQDRGAAQARLFRVGDGFHLLLDANARQGGVLRRALMLPPGDYRLEISGQRTQPSPYAVTLAPADPGPGRPEGEPDDSPALARDLSAGQALRGILAEGDPAHVTFAVPMADHLWELRGVQGLSDLALVDGNDLVVGAWRASKGALVLRLALNPGRYQAQLRGDGPYALRLADLGPRPEGFEVEPNEHEAAAMPLRPGASLGGDFHAEGDFDLYELTLAAPTPLTLTVTPPDDGTLRAELDLDGIGTRVTDVTPEAGPLSYTAVFPIGRHLIRLQARDEGVSGRYALRLARTEIAPEDEPLGHMTLPGDGRIAAEVGGFDGQDRIFVPLPVGAGTVALTCRGAPDWAVGTFDDQVLARAGSGQVVMLDYGPDLGGAVELVLDGGAQVAPYACRVAFAAALALPKLAHEDRAEGEAPMTAAPGHRIEGAFADAQDGDGFAIQAAEGTLLGLRCDTEADRTRARMGDHLAQALGAKPLPDGTRVFVAEAAQAIELFPRDGTFPQPWACDVLDQFATPAEMGPPAPLTRPAPAGLLQAGRPDWLVPEQITDDLDMALSVAGLDQPFRAYSRLGQQADLVLTLQNPGAARTVDLEISALAEGWRISPAAARASVPAGGAVQVPVTLDLPPMQSAATDPQLRVVATAMGQRGALTVPVGMGPTAPERGGQRYRAAPDGLRGGLDPLRFGLGARVLTMDGAAVEAADWAFLHDGDAPHSDAAASLAAGQVVFELAGVAPVVALHTHLRTTEDRARWPTALTWELSADGQVWGPPVTQVLTASDLPQIMELPAPVTARFARLTRHGCRADPACGAVALAEVGLVASPDWRPAGGLDLADPALGGHVVTARMLGGRDIGENPFGGGWNADFLTLGTPDRLARASDSIGTAVEVILAFTSNRAARVAAIDWVGDAGDAARLPQVRMEYSLTGPAGPWTPLPDLPAPAMGQPESRLTLPAPQWMRALRLTLIRDAERDLILPDSLRLWEDPTAPSILGLWQDDAPEAGYEEGAAQTATPPTGGPDAAGAVGLALAQQVTSSVQLERNEDWWRITVPPGPKQMLTLHFPGAALPEFTASLTAPDGTALPLSRATTPAGDLILTAPASPGPHLLHITEPPRNVAILWDTSGSVGPYIPRILGAVRLWAMSLKPGRDRIQLLPFGMKDMLLPDWADHPDQVAQALAALPQTNSSDAENAMGLAATALQAVDGQRGIVIITDAETSQGDQVWTPLLAARPRVVSLSIDSSDPRGVAFLKDWSALNGGYFTRVTGAAGLADGLDLAAALFRAPKSYALTATLTEIREAEGQAQLTLTATKPKRKAKPTGGIEVVLDASGSMLKRMEDGQRRIAVAHDALSHLVTKTLPKGTPFAFRAFGLAPDDCSSELKLPFAPLNPRAAEKAIRATPAVNLAKTAIAASLAAAAQDLAQTDPPRVIVLVTDGEETCDGDVAAEIARMRAMGLDIRLSIVGFAVDDAGLAQTFGQWAEQGGGRYVPAGDSAALTAALGDATLPRFAADRLYLDGRVETTATLKLDAPLTLPAGTYRLRPLQTAVGKAVEVTLTDGQPLALTYDPEIGLLQK